MKLKKSESVWCWANFKYEAVPTFCFICGLIGHGEKFRGRLFKTPEERIEKPYGAWMRADPRRKSYSLGSKWLRQGEGTPTQATELPEVGGSTIVSEKVGVDGHNHVKSGGKESKVERVIRDTVMSDKGNRNGVGREDQQGIIQNRYDDNEATLQETNLTDIIEFTDPKRRRTDEPIGDKPIVNSDGVDNME